MLFREIIAVYSEYYVNLVNEFYTQNAELLNF
jgi:hypothetical protein